MSLSSDDFYEILGVPKSADDREIKKAFHKLSLKCHPDKNPPEKHEEATENFKKISEAYEALSNPEKRKVYDKYGRDGLRESAAGGGPGAGGFPFEQMFGGAGHPFASMFGGMFGGGFGGGGQQRPRGGKGPSKNQEIGITFAEMANGGTRRLRISHQVRCNTCNGSGARTGKSFASCGGCQGRGMKVRVMRMGPNQIMQQSAPCDECRGTGKAISESDKCPSCQGKKTEHRESIVTIDIKKGTANGEHFTIANHADWMEDTDEAGDINIIFREEQRDDMRREGHDLIIPVTILLSEALCGFKIPITHPSGEQIVIESAGVIKPGQRRRVPKMGFLRHSSGKPDDYGDLIVEFEIIFPDTLEAPRDELIGKLLPKRKLMNEQLSDKKVYPLEHVSASSTSASSKKASRHSHTTAEEAEPEPLPPNCHVQ